MHEQFRSFAKPIHSSWREPTWTGCKPQPLSRQGVSQEGQPLLGKREHQLLVTSVERDPEVHIFHHLGQLQHGLDNVNVKKVPLRPLVRLPALVLVKQREKVQALVERHGHHLPESGV